MSLGREFIALPPPMARAGEPRRGRPPRPVALAAAGDRAISGGERRASAAPGLGELGRGAALAAIAVIAILLTLRILRGARIDRRRGRYYGTLIDHR
jgi:hypothetical protein